MKCSVRNCGLCQSKNRPNLTFHRLPRNKSKQKKWLENIGRENIRPGTKDIYVCSLHFADHAFNKTLNIVRLRDDAVPTIFTKQNHSSQPALVASPRSSTAHPSLLSIENVMGCPQPSTSSCDSYSQDAKSQLESTNALPQESCPTRENVMGCPQPSTSSFDSYSQDASQLELITALEELKNLEEKVKHQKKKIKCLNEKVRYQKIKVTNFKNIIIELKEHNLINNEK